MKKITGLLIFLLAGIVLSGQEVVKDELFKVSRESVEFVNYEGPHIKFETADEIRGIGIYLGNQFSITEAMRSYNSRYTIIHAFTEQGEGLFNADILVIEKDAVVDHIKNVRRILSGYLESAYSYTREDADLIAEFASYYNAVYRGDFQYFISAYNQVVIDNLDSSKAGISTRYLEWPGATQLVLPLTASGALKIDTDTISNDTVIEDLRTQEDMGIEPRKEIVELKEREIEAEQQAIDEQKAKLQEDTAVLESEKEKLQEDKNNLTDSEIQQKEEIISNAESDIAAKQEELAVQEEKQQDRQEAVQEERQQIAEDEKALIAKDNSNIQETAPAAETVPFLIIDGDNSDLMGQLALINTDTGEIDKRSSINTVRGRRYYLSGEKLLIISGIDRAPQAIRLMFVDSGTLEVLTQGDTDLFSESDLLIDGNNIYAVIRKDGKWYIGRFNGDLELQASSSETVLSYTPIQKNKGVIYVQLDNSRVVPLDMDSLEISGK